MGASNQKHVEKGLEVLTGVVRSYKAAGKADRALIRAQTKAIGQDLNKRIVRAIQIGEAKARRVANRARVNLAATKKALLIEISERVEATADKLFKTIQGNHKTIADNYLSFKAYAVTASSKITGLVNEYSSVCNGVRMRWPMGLGKYLLLKLQQSMLSKGVLQVDKVSNHAGNWVFINGRAVGLSNKLND